MVKRPTGSDGEPSSPNCGASAGVKARHLTSSKPHIPRGFQAQNGFPARICSSSIRTKKNLLPPAEIHLRGPTWSVRVMVVRDLRDYFLGSRSQHRYRRSGHVFGTGSRPLSFIQSPECWTGSRTQKIKNPAIQKIAGFLVPVRLIWWDLRGSNPRQTD
jgi:hypothetical protein